MKNVPTGADECLMLGAIERRALKELTPLVAQHCYGPDAVVADDDDSGWTVLMECSARGWMEAVEWLCVVGGCDVNHKTGNGSSALSCAFSNEEWAVARTLICHGAQLEVVYGHCVAPEWALDFADRIANCRNAVVTVLAVRKFGRWSMLHLNDRGVVGILARHIWSLRGWQAWERC